MKPQHISLIGAFIDAAALLARRPDGAQPSYVRLRKRSWRVGGFNVPHQGDRERARRRRQIERGQLKAENGLVRG